MIALAQPNSPRYRAQFAALSRSKTGLDSQCPMPRASSFQVPKEKRRLLEAAENQVRMINHGYSPFCRQIGESFRSFLRARDARKMENAMIRTPGACGRA